MSALNVFIDEKAALVGVDTLGIAPVIGRGEYLKMVSLHHVNAVIAMRGTEFVFMALMPSVVGFTGTIEQLAEMLPQIMEGVVEHCRTQFNATDEQIGYDLALVGFSESQDKAVGYYFHLDEGGKGIPTTSNIHSGYRSPCLPEWRNELGSIPATREGMKALTKRQSELSEGISERFGVGGRLFIAEITKGKISIEMAAELPVKAVPNG